jgi:hypothetical protein
MKQTNAISVAVIYTAHNSIDTKFVFASTQTCYTRAIGNTRFTYFAQSGRKTAGQVGMPDGADESRQTLATRVRCVAASIPIQSAASQS